MSKDGGARKGAKHSEELALGLLAEQLEKALGKVASCAFKAHEAKTHGSFGRRVDRLFDALEAAREAAGKFGEFIEDSGYASVAEPEVVATAAPAPATRA
jgi:hypothetical protein